MDGQIHPISTLRLTAPLQNCCIGLAIAAVGVIVCYFWLDQPLTFFLHRNVEDITVFVWLQRLPVTSLAGVVRFGMVRTLDVDGPSPLAR